MTVDNTSSVPVYQPGENWESLIESSDEILGYDLARDETADDLVGVPFAITRVQFRPGVIRDKVQQAYVSIECRVSDNLDVRLINTRRESSRLNKLAGLESLAFGPGSHVIFNDGSTGVYRQIVKYLYTKQYIALAPPVVEAGTYGECSFDKPPSQWAGFTHGDEYADDKGFVGYMADIRLYCPRGLRNSLYENDYTQTGKTRYLG